MFLSVAFVTIAVSLLVDKWLNIMVINKQSTTVEPSEPDAEIFKKFDDRINTTWEHISGIKQSVEALKLQIGMKRQ